MGKDQIQDSDVNKWICGALAALPPTGPRRAVLEKKMMTALGERDVFRLQKLSPTTPVPVAGLQAQLRKDLQALPVDFVGQADQFATFLTASKHPLTGNLAGKCMEGKATTQQPGKERQLRAEAMHGMAPPPASQDGEAAPQGKSESVFMPVNVHASAPQDGDVSRSAPTMKVKELFKLPDWGV